MQSGLLRGTMYCHSVRRRRMQSGPVCCNGSRRSVVHTPSRDTRHGVTANVAAKGVGTDAGSRESMSAATGTASGVTSATTAPCVTSTTAPAGVTATPTATTTRGSGIRQGRR
jgi:hypothetical protein